MERIRTTCAQVTKVTTKGPETNYFQDWQHPVSLDIVDKEKGEVVCPLFKNGLCGGKKSCVVNEVDIYTTVVGTTIPQEKEKKSQ